MFTEEAQGSVQLPQEAEAEAEAAFGALEP